MAVILSGPQCVKQDMETIAGATDGTKPLPEPMLTFH